MTIGAISLFAVAYAAWTIRLQRVAEQRACPDCAETIKASASVCR